MRLVLLPPLSASTGAMWTWPSRLKALPSSILTTRTHIVLEKSIAFLAIDIGASLTAPRY
ncbi:hypothetical protein DFQ26_009337, partial [Actinomortierella ambigua]